MGPIHPSLALPAPLMLGIAPRTAHLLSFLFTTTYVGSLYLAQKALLPSKPAVSSATKLDEDTSVPNGHRHDEPKPGDRNHPATIRVRMKAVTFATAAAIGGVMWTVKRVGKDGLAQTVKSAFTLMGFPLFFSLPTTGILLSYLLAPIMMFGPLVATYLDGDLPLQAPPLGPGGLQARISRAWRSWTIVDTRNYVAGPLTEELVFRSTILAVSLLGKLSIKSLVFGTPLWFGIAHAHHAWDVFRTQGSNVDAAVRALLTMLFQLGYTTLFGWFAAYLYLRTGSVLPSLVSHMFCNYMGIYLPTSAVQRHPSKSLLIWASYGLGIAGFVTGLRLL